MDACPLEGSAAKPTCNGAQVEGTLACGVRGCDVQRLRAMIQKYVVIQMQALRWKLRKYLREEQQLRVANLCLPKMSPRSSATRFFFACWVAYARLGTESAAVAAGSARGRQYAVIILMIWA